MKRIEKLEKIDESVNIKQQGVNYTFYWAYRHTIETDKKLLNFDSVIWNSDVPEIIKECKKFNIKEFTISRTDAHFFNILADFEKYNCTIAGMAKMQSNVAEANSNAFFSATYDSDSSDADKKLDAIKMRIN